MSRYSYIEQIYEDAEKRGHRVGDITTGIRKNSRGIYAYVSAEFIVPLPELEGNKVYNSIPTPKKDNEVKENV